MKTITSILLLFTPFLLLSQQTITSVSNGQATNPLVWDCSCFPSANDHIVVNHNIQMNIDWIISNGGSITVNWGASFIEDAQHRGILIDGNGSSFVNHGTTDMTSFALTNGAMVHNHYSMSLDSALYVSAGSTYMNHGNTVDLDSTYIEGTLINESVFRKGDLFNDGTIINTGYIRSDSLGNRGVFNSTSGDIEAYDFGNNGTFEITGTSYMSVSNNAANDGYLTVGSDRSLRITNSFSNFNTTNGTVVQNDGLIEVGNDFQNLDTIQGSGLFCIGNSSANYGDVLGTLDICDNTGTGIFDSNTGNTEATVTDCLSGCNVGVATQKESLSITIYPNPVDNTLHIKGAENSGTFAVIDVTGKQIMNGKIRPTISMSDYTTGIYFIRLNTQNGMSMVKFIKR